MTAEFNYDPAVVALHDAAMGDVVVAVKLYPVGSGASYYTGNIWPEMDLTVGVGGTARGTLSGDGDGAVTWVP